MLIWGEVMEKYGLMGATSFPSVMGTIMKHAAVFWNKIAFVLCNTHNLFCSAWFARVGFRNLSPHLNTSHLP